jgi:serine phosphatase RsbU (regulator of sigma subunit)
VSRPAELANVLARGAAMRLLDDHARLRRCRVAVFDGSGAAIRADGDLAAARPSGLNGSARVDGVSGAAAVSPVVAFERVVGYVVARGEEGDRRGEEPRRVAEHGAALLAELCAREYELDDLSREILGSYEELNLFYDLAGELAGAPDADAACRVVLAEACRVIAPEDAWILLADGPRGALRVAAAMDPAEVGRGLPAGAGRAGAAMSSRVAEPLDDVRQFPAESLTEFERRAERSLVTVALCVPGRDERPALGVLQLRDKRDGGAFTAGDLKLAQAIASQAAVLIQNSRLIGLERELQIARTIQQSLLPGAPPALAGYDVAGACIAASNVGGDYFDHLVAAQGSLTFLVADVSGHNLAAALLQTAARAAFRAAAQNDPSPGAILRRASRTVHDDLSRADLFLTAWLGCLDVNSATLAFSDAGHNPAILHRAATGRTSWLSTGGIPIGVVADAEFDEGSVQLEPGDVVVVYTDGLTEACAPAGPTRQYGEERLAAAVARFAHLPAAEIVRELQADVARFCGERPAGDDRSLVVLRRLGA